jgi:Sulfatase
MALLVSPAERNKLKHLVVAFTAGNLCFVRRWYDLERLQGAAMDYYRESPQSPNLLVGTLLASFLLTCVFYFGWRWSIEGAPWRKRFALATFSLVLVFPLESIRRYWNIQTGRFDIGMNIPLILLEILLGTGMVMALRGKDRIARAAQKSVFALAILVPILVLDFSSGLATREPESAFAKLQPLPMFDARPRHSPRVVWVVFDEMDQNLTFDVRPKSLEMPEIDRLRGEALVANHATPTADWTVIALPSLLSGRVFGVAEMRSARLLEVTPEGTSETLDWRTQPNVFKRARAMGVNAEIIGWHHPYCRVLGDQVVSCFAMPSGHPTHALLRETHAAEDGIWKTTGYLFRLQMENLHDLFRRDQDSVSENLKSLYLQQRQQRQYFEIRDRAYRAAVDPRIGLLVLHLPLPHPFAFYNRKEKSFNLDGKLDYFDNLALADRTIGELRLALEQARMWEDTTILITSDHGIRPNEWEGRYGWTDELERLTKGQHGKTVPFILKLAGAQRPAEFTKEFCNVLSGSLALAVLDGKVSTSEQAQEWLEGAISHGASDYRSRDYGTSQSADSMR